MKASPKVEKRRHPPAGTDNLTIREANTADIPQLSQIRLSVRENVLSNPGLITGKDYTDYLTRHGKGWVCEKDGVIAGFAIVGLVQHNIWALFVRPGYESQGIGQQLQQVMLDWYFKQTPETVWLSTGPNTRAEQFYQKAGWQEAGRQPPGEIRFEMTARDWQDRPGKTR
jgi:GNAT superfamily N-acetyltransferase